jgi:hypothetical protein
MADPLNPYAAPTTDHMLAEQDPSSFVEAEQVRRMFFKHERAVKSISAFYMFGCLFAGLYLAACIGMAYNDPLARPYALIGFAVLVLLFLVFYWIARGLWRLNPRIRTPLTLLSIIGLLGLPLGTILNAYILYLIHCEKGKYVFSPEYKEIIAQTLYIRPRISIVVWILFGLLLTMFGIGVIVALIDPHG